MHRSCAVRRHLALALALAAASGGGAARAGGYGPAGSCTNDAGGHAAAAWRGAPAAGYAAPGYGRGACGPGACGPGACGHGACGRTACGRHGCGPAACGRGACGGRACCPRGCGHCGGCCHGLCGQFGHCLDHDTYEKRYFLRSQGKSWHSAWYDPWEGRPIALVVPPTAEFQTQYAWGVPSSRVAPIYHQFRRPYPGPGAVGGSGGGFLPTPNQPGDTVQFGVNAVRGPWGSY